MSLVEVRLTEPARCPSCDLVASAVRFHPVEDGATTIITELVWIDARGHEWPSGLPELYVDSQVPVHAQLQFSVAPAA